MDNQFSTKVQKQFCGERVIFSINCAETVGYLYTPPPQKIQLYSTHHKIQILIQNKSLI